jgi:succinate dehydrogenase hydrophobic anchor subunit
VKERRRKARQDYVLMRVTSVVMVLTAAAVLVVICLMVALHS